MTTKTTDYTAIKSFEDALAATGRPNTPDLSGFPEDLREYFAAQYEAIVINEAVNKGEKKLDWSDANQRKCLPWFIHKDTASSGFAFYVTAYSYSTARAGIASRLCLTDDKRARYVGETFTAIHDAILRK